MFSALSGKKLLLLGGIQRTCVIVKRAQELGVYVVVADYDVNSPAKKIADEAVLIDATDADALVDYCIANHVDGLLTAYVDFLLSVCKEVSERIGKPFYATDLMIEMSTDKASFKEHCEKYGVPVPKTYDVSSQRDAENIRYPVFLKPTDASGSRGADICYNPNDFREKYERALSFSKKKAVTVEEYLSGTEFILDYILIDGKAHMLSMADRFTSEGRPLAINNPNLMILPSVHLREYYDKVDAKVRRMFHELGFRNGVIFLQGYVKEGNITFYEMGCRLGGSWPYIDAHFHGINPLDMLISHSLTGRMLPFPKSNISKITPFFPGLAAIIYFTSSIKEGDIAKVEGIEELSRMNEVVCIIQYYYEGDHFSLGTLTDTLFLAVHMVAPDYDSLKHAVKRAYSAVKYLDSEGNPLFMEPVDMDAATNYGKKLHQITEAINDENS